MYGNTNFAAGILIAGAVIGAAIAAALFIGLPWLFDLIKPWLHSITA